MPWWKSQLSLLQEHGRREGWECEPRSSLFLGKCSKWLQFHGSPSPLQTTYYLHHLTSSGRASNPSYNFLCVTHVIEVNKLPMYRFSSRKMPSFVAGHTHISVFSRVVSKYTLCPPNIIDFLVDCLNCLQPQTVCLWGPWGENQLLVIASGSLGSRSNLNDWKHIGCPLVEKSTFHCDSVT